MQNVRVQFTIPNVDKVANLDVYVNGEQRNIRFRVETFDWDQDNGSSEDLVSLLRYRILNYDSDWELYHIGTPYKDSIPVTFRFKGDKEEKLEEE
ncbi:MAG: hypothetical protein RLN81_05195 [Balneolaceae bacterium]